MQDVDHFDELGADSVEDQIVGMHAATDPMLLIAGNKRMPARKLRERLAVI